MAWQLDEEVVVPRSAIRKDDSSENGEAQFVDPTKHWKKCKTLSLNENRMIITKEEIYLMLR